MIETLLSAGQISAGAIYLSGLCMGPEFVTSCKGSQTEALRTLLSPWPPKHVAASGAGKHIGIVTANTSPGSVQSLGPAGATKPLALRRACK